MTMIKTLIICVTLTVNFCAHASEFVIAKKKSQATPRYSRTKLKERLGQATKDAFHASRSLVRHVGKVNVLMADLHEKKHIKTINPNDFTKVHKQGGALLVTLASLQKKFSGALECLIDNRAPFKKAGRNDLGAAYKTMYDFVVTLEQSKEQIKACHKAFNQCRSVENRQQIVGKSQSVIDSKKQDVELGQTVAKLSNLMQAAASKAIEFQNKFKADNCLKHV